MVSEDIVFVVYEGSKQQTSFSWDRQPIVIGRHLEAALRTDEPTMSARHAEIVDSDSGIRLRDLGSLNGTQVNGHRVFDTMLVAGDRIEIGATTIVVQAANTAPEPAPGEEDDTAEDTGQTVRVRLDQLRTWREPELGEDGRILVLRDLFEALKAHDKSTQDVLAEVRKILGPTFARSRVFILRDDGDGQWRDPQSTDRPSMSFVIEAARADSAILSTSLPADSRFAASVSARMTGIQTAIAAPVGIDRKVEAIIYIDRLAAPPFRRRDLNLLGIAANHISAVLENIARFRALKEAREALSELNRGLEETVAERTAELRQQAGEIARLAEAKDELLGIAAHDIRGPLTVIQGTIELLQAQIGEVDRESVQDSLTIIYEATRGLSRLLSELLDAKSIESGQIHLNVRRYLLKTVLGQVMPIARLAAENKNIAVEVRAPDDLEVHADARRLAQAITNLVLNAIKFSERGSEIRVIGAQTVGGGVTITVQDEGIGIPREELDQIFGSFAQGEAGRDLGGSGLGLMIAKRLVELHDGALEVASTVGVGTRFVLTLPG